MDRSPWYTRECEELTLEVAALVEAAMAMSAQFFSGIVVQRPIPAKPYPTAYEYHPSSGATLCYNSGYSPTRASGNRELRCKPSFPSSSSIPHVDQRYINTFV